MFVMVLPRLTIVLVYILQYRGSVSKAQSKKEDWFHLYFNHFHACVFFVRASTSAIPSEIAPYALRSAWFRYSSTRVLCSVGRLRHRHRPHGPLIGQLQCSTGEILRALFLAVNRVQYEKSRTRSHPIIQHAID